MNGLRSLWVDSGIELAEIPLIEILARLANNAEGHMRMLQPAELRTLSTPDARLVHFESEIVPISWQQVFLAVNIWRPEAMDHVARCAVDIYDRSHRHMDLIGGTENAIGLVFVGIF